MAGLVGTDPAWQPCYRTYMSTQQDWIPHYKCGGTS